MNKFVTADFSLNRKQLTSNSTEDQPIKLDPLVIKSASLYRVLTVYIFLNLPHRIDSNGDSFILKFPTESLGLVLGYGIGILVH